MKLLGITSRALLLVAAVSLCGSSFAFGQAQRVRTVTAQQMPRTQTAVRHAPQPSHHGGQNPYIHNGYPHNPWRYNYGYYGYFGYGWPYYWAGYYSGYYNPNGAVDLNVFPKTAEVYLNGNAVGKVGKYDGFPQYLWLQPGNHELIFYLDGYQTVRQEVEVVPGIVQRTRLHLEPGQPTPVAALSVARQRREEERRSLYERYSKDRPGTRNEASSGPSTAGEDPSSDVTATASTSDRDSQSAILKLSIQPSDAVIYLDGRFLGTASSLTARSGTLTLASGTHTMEVIRPGYINQVTTLDLVPGKTLAVNISLEAETK